MYTDALNKFSDDQAITATAASTNVIDLGVNRDIGPGQPIPVVVQVTEAFNNLTSLKVEVQTDDNEAFSSATTLAEQTKLLAAIDAIGDKFSFSVVPDGTQRYLRLNYTVAGSAPSTGKVWAGMVLDRQTAKSG